MKIPVHILFAALLTSLAGGSALAASSCKGQSESVCGKSADCAWVDGYTTKNDRKIKGYCRSKGKSATAAKPAQPAQSATPSVRAGK